MPEYLHPGVYIEEQPAPQSIEGVSTSTAGFVGVTEKGPTTGLPQFVNSFPAFTRLYGGYLDEETWGSARFLAYAVEAFFNNGGQRAFIMRVVGAGASAASLTLNDGFITRLAEDTAGALSARGTVKLNSLRGISVGSDLTFQEAIAGTVQSQTQEVTAYDSANRTVTLDAPLSLRYTAAGCEVVISGVADAPAPSAGTPRLEVEASSEGEWGRSIRVTIADVDGAAGLAEAAGVETTLRAVNLAFSAAGPDVGDTSIALTAPAFALVQAGDVVEFRNTSGDFERRTITLGGGTTIQWTGAGNGALENDYTGGGSTAQRITAIRNAAANPVVPITDATGFQAGDLARLTQGNNTQLVLISAVNAPQLEVTLNTAAHPIARAYQAGDHFTLATAGRSGSNRLDLRSTNNFYPRAVIEVDDGQTKTYHTVSSISGRSLVLTANLGRDVASGTAVRNVEFALSLKDGVSSETFTGLSMDSAAADNFVENVVNPRSRLAQVTVLASSRPAPFNIPRTVNGSPANLTAGANGGIPTADDYRGEDNGPGQRTGIKALADIDLVSILAAPGVSDASVHGELISQCELLKDRFAVLDPAVGSVIGSGGADDILVQRSNVDTLYAAMYYPWLRISDPLYPDDANGRLVPPSGHMIGIYARVDTSRGVHKAPANEVVRGIFDVELKLTDRDQDILNVPNNINVIRDFRDSGRGIRVWGARVATRDSAWKYIPVRRLFIFLEESLDEGLQWVVFEPNAEPLWARVRQTIEGFLRRVWRDGALAGVTEEEAFFVRCDRTTMTEDEINNGQLIVIVGVAPVRPAEFVIIRIGQKTLEAQR